MPNKILKILKEAKEDKWAVGHFNISNLETLRAILGAAQKLRSPVFIGTSESESKFIGLRQAAALARSFREERMADFFLNLDHGKDLDYIREAMEAGYDAVHFDGSNHPLEENIKLTQEVVRLARKKGILVEGEVGEIGGELTEPSEAEKFVRQTKIDILAANVGTWHGQGVKTGIDFPRLAEINKAAKNAFLVLHGGSGVPDDHLKQAVEKGISIAHINTELRQAFTESLKKALKQNPQEVTPYKYLPPVIETVQRLVENKIRLLGSVNKI